jgi:hypothetical protein
MRPKRWFRAKHECVRGPERGARPGQEGHGRVLELGAVHKQVDTREWRTQHAQRRAGISMSKAESRADKSCDTDATRAACRRSCRSHHFSFSSAHVAVPALTQCPPHSLPIVPAASPATGMISILLPKQVPTVADMSLDVANQLVGMGSRTNAEPSALACPLGPRVSTPRTRPPFAFNHPLIETAPAGHLGPPRLRYATTTPGLSRRPYQR